ncbi:MAG: ATP-dependent 6-phosphofructokinase [Desulfuromonadaceae bacterium]|nr:ATP-dependent 6-phosphofructokinase [Desulfuromonadaceae bacterium]
MPSNDLTLKDFEAHRLGENLHQSPMSAQCFCDDYERLLYHSSFDEIQQRIADNRAPLSFEVAGPRKKIFFDPATISCGIVTCGGLCPGTNDVIRAIVMSLYHHYGVQDIYGFRYGYEGLVRSYGHTPLKLTTDLVSRIGESGGTILGSSRGHQDPAEMVATLSELGIGILFTIGGDGTLKGASKIAEEINRQGKSIGVIGIPKTIDNDISYLQTTFGFETAVSEARRSTYAAHTEALGARNGIGLVKLMGRDSGFIAAYTAMADCQVNYCLIPEAPFTLPGLLADLEKRIRQRGHAVIVVAEGAGQDLVTASGQVDASGNTKLTDIGVFLKEKIAAHFAKTGLEMTLKYIDPSYTIRSQPANPHDATFCLSLGHNAVHAGMAGRTNMVVGFWNHQFVHVPMSLATSSRKKISPHGRLWSSVISSTGQPAKL